jgi:hypothetical protein
MKLRLVAAVAVAAAASLQLAGLGNVAAVADTPDMIKEPVAVLQGLDKIAGRVSRFDAPVDKPVTFGTLSIVVRDCEKSAPEARPESAAFLQIYESRPGEERVRRFSGWMFSSSPALSALEHPVYDINLLECVASSAAPAAAPAAAAAAATSTTSAGNSRGNATPPPLPR